MRKLNNKKLGVILLLMIALILVLIASIPSVYCADDNNSIASDLENSVYESLGGIDFGGLDECIQELNKDSQAIFGGDSFFDKVTALINGEFSTDTTSFFSAILSLFFGEIAGFLPMLCIIIAITILCSLVGNIRSDVGSESVGRIVDFVCYGIVIVIVSGCVFSLLGEVGQAIAAIKKQMDIIFPILLTLVASVGGTVTVGMFQPSLALFSNIIIQIFNFVLVPLFTFMFVFSVVGNMTNSVSLNKFNATFRSIFKWVAGICFSIFMGVVMVQGVVAGNFDNVSIRATKFALKSYVPILGGYLSDGFNIVMASSVLIKNAIGGVGIFLALSLIVVPIIKIAILGLGLKLTAAILEPMTKSKISDFLMNVSKNVNMLVVIIAGVGFMYIVSIGMLLISANLG